jgi:hypothetical protein
MEVSNQNANKSWHTPRFVAAVVSSRDVDVEGGELRVSPETNKD